MACKPVLTLAAAAFLLAPGSSWSHVTPAPAFVTEGEPSVIEFEVLNERADHATVALDLTPPPGVELKPEAPPPGWSASIRGDSLRWSGGRIGGTGAVAFPARVTASVRAGGYAFRAVQRYEDGGKVRWEAAFTVLPASGAGTPDEHPGRAIVAAAIGLVVVLATLAGLHLLRRRRTPG